jgi:hypothetical protein
VAFELGYTLEKGRQDEQSLLPLLYRGDFQSSFPGVLTKTLIRDMRDAEGYAEALLGLEPMGVLPAIASALRQLPAYQLLIKNFHLEWEKTARDAQTQYRLATAEDSPAFKAKQLARVKQWLVHALLPETVLQDFEQAKDQMERLAHLEGYEIRSVCCDVYRYFGDYLASQAEASLQAAGKKALGVAGQLHQQYVEVVKKELKAALDSEQAADNSRTSEAFHRAIHALQPLDGLEGIEFAYQEVYQRYSAFLKKIYGAHHPEYKRYHRISRNFRQSTLEQQAAVEGGAGLGALEARVAAQPTFKLVERYLRAAKNYRHQGSFEEAERAFDGAREQLSLLHQQAVGVPDPLGDLADLSFRLHQAYSDFLFGYRFALEGTSAEREGQMIYFESEEGQLAYRVQGTGPEWKAGRLPLASFVPEGQVLSVRALERSKASLLKGIVAQENLLWWDTESYEEPLERFAEAQQCLNLAHQAYDKRSHLQPLEGKLHENLSRYSKSRLQEKPLIHREGFLGEAVAVHKALAPYGAVSTTVNQQLLGCCSEWFPGQALDAHLLQKVEKALATKGLVKSGLVQAVNSQSLKESIELSLWQADTADKEGHVERARAGFSKALAEQEALTVCLQEQEKKLRDSQALETLKARVFGLYGEFLKSQGEPEADKYLKMAGRYGYVARSPAVAPVSEDLEKRLAAEQAVVELSQKLAQAETGGQQLSDTLRTQTEALAAEKAQRVGLEETVSAQRARLENETAVLRQKLTQAEARGQQLRDSLGTQTEALARSEAALAAEKAQRVGLEETVSAQRARLENETAVLKQKLAQAKATGQQLRDSLGTKTEALARSEAALAAEKAKALALEEKLALARVEGNNPRPSSEAPSNVLRFTQPAAQPSVNSVEVEKLLGLVAEGEQDKAEAMLKANPSLALAKGRVRDLSKRRFEAITALQYATWALDRHMWTMLLKYIPKEQAASQLRETGSWVKTHGIHAGMPGGPLDKLCKAYDSYAGSGYSAEHWQKQIGGAQLLLPAHVVNEYCRTDRSFSPCPKFDELILPRTQKIDEGEWFSAVYNGGKIGDKFACFRWSGTEARAISMHHASGAYDQSAVVQLTKTRVQELDVLLTQLGLDQQVSTRQRLGAN